MKEFRWLLALMGFMAFMVVSDDGYASDKGCHLRNEKDERQIEEIIRKKEQAVNQGKLERFLSILDADSPMYVQEQKRWFQDAVQTIDLGTYRLRILCLEEETDHLVKARIEQTYAASGRVKRIVYPLRMKITANGWKDADMAFARLGNQSIAVYYTHPSLKKQALLAFQTIQEATAALGRKYGWKARHVEVKLYHQPDWFCESVKPSLPEWAGGWHEANQAIKLIGGQSDEKFFAAGIIHELTHQMMSDLTNDNAAYWLQEGAAMYYEAHLLSSYHAKHPVWLLKKPMSIKELEKTRLERLPAGEAEAYYLSSYLWFKKLINQYGESGVKKVLAHLKKKTYIDADSDQKNDILNRHTNEALQATFPSFGDESGEEFADSKRT